MAYEVQVYEVVIASPSDLKNERMKVRETVLQWNAEHSKNFKIIFQPVMWEMDTVPEVNIRPQESINRQIIQDSDIMIAMFWSKLGSSTGTSISGTVEEIDLFIAAGKPVALYFSDKSTSISNIDAPQLEALRKYKQSISETSYYNIFKSTNGLKQLIFKYLTVTAQKLSRDRNNHSILQSNDNNEFIPISSNNSIFKELFVQASHSNANGYWLSIVADYNDGYSHFDTDKKQHVLDWSTQLLYTIFPQSDVNKQYGKDYVLVTNLLNNSMIPIFRVQYFNAGVVIIQWRGDSLSIPLEWVITLCLVSVIQVVNSPIVTGKSLGRLGIALSNAPEGGINTNGVFTASSTDVYLMSRNSTWESVIVGSIDIDEIIKEFVRDTLSSWGYYGFEKNLNELIIKNVKQEFLLQQRGLTFL
ncbi:nucleoside 2-deoxyribosyltransferase/regulation of enolase protein 1 (concanavalin A-like superfamily) [Paenibacillus favisporus]|uniref:Nucleoside 2-deoxyribosyltransferase/regulation of enolase protein 1 (Concanavalin A-like superfamily) n=1 Tax=Paenibacillus favisporus TaxID=221028 RepID=A0ABV2F995_9BACL